MGSCLTFYLAYVHIASLIVENGKFLFAAKKVRCPIGGTDYVISMNAEDFSRSSNTYVGKLSSNFLGTKFTIFDSQPPHSGSIVSNDRSSQRFYSKHVSPKVLAGNYNIANIAYEFNALGTRGPRRM